MSKKKKLIVVSSVLAACMLCSLSVLALSSQEKTENISDNSEVISERSGEQGLTAEDFIIQFIPGKATREDIESVIGKPDTYVGSGIIRNLYCTVDGKKILVTYTNSDQIFKKEVLKEVQIFSND